MDPFIIRDATADDIKPIHALIAAHQSEGHLLPRELSDVERRVRQFVVCDAGGRLCGCAELTRLSPVLAEVRSLVVAPEFRRSGVAAALIEELRRRATAAGFETLCALAHDARLFVHRNFSIVPHAWLPEKIAKDCVGCSLFRHCGQHAMLLPLKHVGRQRAAHIHHRQVAVA
ncbi:MAG: GNAT family N-acetyltransferase [Vicinamibacterales bacterium]